MIEMPRPASRLPAPVRSKACAMPAHSGLRPDDGERVACARKQPANPSKQEPVCGREWKSGCLTPTHHNDLLPKHEDFCFQRRSRSKQIDDEAKYQSDESDIRHGVARF